MNINNLVLILVCYIFLSSCSTPKIAYFQDADLVNEESISHVLDIRVQPGDKISIIINSKDPLLSELFNLPIITNRVGENYTSTFKYPQGISVYTINKSGDIDFPVIGKIHIENMSREEIAECIKQKLTERNLVKDAVVTVEFSNLTFSVLGEVKNPGQFRIEKDKITVLDAISMAGDLTIHGKRECVKVQREESCGKRKTYQIDLSSSKSLYASPAFYLQQNDIVYIEPNSYKAKDSTVNNKALRWSSILISLCSVLTAITVAIVK